MSPVVAQRLARLAQDIAAASHGGKTALCQAAAIELGLSLPTIYRMLPKVSIAPKPRKRREDAGESALSRDEALWISGVLVEAIRKNDKRLMSIEGTVKMLRENKKINAERIDPQTGEVLPLSAPTIGRALRAYRLHPDQLLAPAPVQELASLHPNHVWQVDASLCVLYYLTPKKGEKTSGLQVMDHKVFYKNKPKNLARIAADRVWSYEITDHASGWIYVTYVMGAESGINLCNTLIDAMQERSNGDIMHGVPKILMMDPGSANTAGMTLNLCSEDGLNIRIIPHKAGAARVTGQVENARNIIERQFESGLKFQNVDSLEELNALAAKWRANFNATKRHSRHGKTRSAAWMLIKADQLIKAPPVAVCRELAVATPLERTVKPKLRIDFHGAEYNVRHVPGINVGDKVLITRNPWTENDARLIAFDADGQKIHHVIPKIDGNGDFNFSTEANVIGEDYTPMPKTQHQKNKDELDQFVYGVGSAEEVVAAKKKRALPFGGTLKPWEYLDKANLPEFLPRKGRTHGLSVTIEIPPLTHVEAAKLLRTRMGDAWNAESMAWLKKEFPGGVPAGEVDDIVKCLTRPAAPVLRVVGE